MKVDHANDRLFKQLLGKKLRRVTRELGFPDVPPTVFDSEDILIFQQHIPKMSTSHQIATKQLERSLHNGRVTNLQTLTDGRTQLSADFNLSGYRCSIQLQHRREQWKMTGSPYIVKAPRQLAVPLTVTGVSAVLVLGGLWLWSTGGFSSDSNAMSVEDAVQFVEEQGYIVMTPEQKNDIVAVAEENGYEKAQQKLSRQKDSDEQDPKDNDKNDDDQDDKKEKVLTFTMKEGMTSQDVISALKENGFIEDELAFAQKLEKSGIATKVTPGTYTFTSEMSEKEILQELE